MEGLSYIMNPMGVSFKKFHNCENEIVRGTTNVRAERAVHKIHRPKNSAAGITVIINGSLG